MLVLAALFLPTATQTETATEAASFLVHVDASAFTNVTKIIVVLVHTIRPSVRHFSVMGKATKS